MARGAHDMLVDALLQGVPVGPMRLHGLVKLVIVSLGERNACEEGGGRARHPVQRPSLLVR